MEKGNTEYFQYIIKQIDIVDVMTKLGIEVKKKGRALLCLCPFHDDHHPSLHIYKSSNQYHCFTCGAHGNIFSLIKEIKKCDFHDAITWIEDEFPEVLIYKPKAIKINENKISIFSNPYELAYECYKNMSEEEEEKLKDFAQKRGYKLEFLKNAKVFFSGKNKLQKNYNEQNFEARDKLENEKIQLIRRIAVFNKNSIKDGYKDYFNDRVLITLEDYKNNIKGFSGRAIEDKDKPKYIFSKNLPKGDMLYRLNNVKNELDYESEKKRYIDLYLVEGVFDALRLESLKINSVAVLGSHITFNQVSILEEFLDELDKKNIQTTLHIFMDSDAAGIKGIFKSIENIFKSNICLKCYMDVVVIRGDNEKRKDADELLKDIKTKEDAIKELELYRLDIFSFLFAYFSTDINLKDIALKAEPEKIYEDVNSLENKIIALNNIKNIIPDKILSMVLERYSAIETRNYIFDRVKEYLLNTGKKVYELNNKAKLLQLTMQNALEVSRNSYKKEILSLDDYTWDRILMGADAFYEYFISLLKKGEHLHIPLLTMYYPKNKENDRIKSIYIHEELILQQYVLNELLGIDLDMEYEHLIPAVRYNPDQNEAKITTGKGYYNFYRNSYDKVVSFAYQINTKAVNNVSSSLGMFRPYYECWKDYISFIQDGVKRLSSDNVYRIKLDIKGFYDNISKVVVRSKLMDFIDDAISYSKIRFKDIGWNNKADVIVEWILYELFEYKYYNPKCSGVLEKERVLVGIPQGPNLSAYIANIILFELDKQVMEYVNNINSKRQDGKIDIRFARYVDDMIVIASNPTFIVDIKNIIEEEVYKLNLSLSDKTDKADSISKEEAIEWTTSEKGGLGVSTAFDFDEHEDINSVIENNYGWDKVDRHKTLDMLSNLIVSEKFDESILEDENDFYDIASLFFKTKEVRFNDIIRFSKYMIFYLVKNSVGEYSLEKVFFNQWNKLIEKSDELSLFVREKIEVLSYLEAIIQIININTLF